MIRALLLLAPALASCSFEGRAQQEPVPDMLHLMSRGSRYMLPGEFVSKVLPSDFRMAGVAFRNGRQITEQPPDKCGVPSSIAGHGSPWIFYFRKPLGVNGGQQVVAVGVDRMEASSRNAAGFYGPETRRTEWKPRLSTPVPDGIMCDVMYMPMTERDRVPWSGGRMFCASFQNPVAKSCYAEFRRHGTIWMTEFQIKNGDTPDDRISYATRFIDSIHVEDDAHAPIPSVPLNHKPRP